MSSTIRFLHTADWQLGKPFGMVPDEARKRARRASLPSATIQTEAELDAWFSQARDSIRTTLKDGPSIV